MPGPRQQLQDALDVLETAFAGDGGRSFAPGGCGHCYSPSELDALAGPPHRVPDELVCSVAAKSTEHWDGFSGLYGRMTPRILGLLVAGRLHVGYGLVASRLVAAGWRAWPEPQRRAVERFWCAWWRVALDDHPGAHRIVDVLEIVSVSTGTLIPWLDTWSAIWTPAADRHLFDAVAWWLPEWALSDLWFGWDNELHATPDLMPWLLSLDEGRLDPAQRLEIQQLAEWLDAAANTP